MQQQSLGQFGEAMAQQHLRQRGYVILAQNWLCRQGELDIIAMDGETIVFVEVKTRHSDDTALAFAAITPTKRERLLAAAHHFLIAHECDEMLWRVDAIAIVLPKNGKPVLEHVEDALGW